MKKFKTRITVDQSKEIMLNILKEVHVYCSAHKLKYSLYAGSLLGAIRHNGFIPWDDDIDIVMPRTDYEYFCKNFTSNEISIITPFNNKDYYLPWAKAYNKNTIKIEPYRINKDYLFGVDIDIFPADYIDSNTNFDLITKTKNKLKQKLFFKWKKYDLKFYFLHPSNLFKELFSCSPNSYCKKLDILYQKFNSEENKFYMINSLFFNRPLYPADIFDNLILHKFENNMFYIFSKYETFLKLTYGEDYMKLPPKEKQKSHHVNNIYIKEE